jgi:hypothetical protein
LDSGHSRTAAALLLGRVEGTVLPNDVADAGDLTRRLESHGFDSVSLLGTPYVPLVTGALARQTGGRLPYLRGRAAAFGFDVVVLARRG